MKKYGAIAITICLCILSMLITCFPASAADGFETNMSDWKSACGTAWTLDENGYSNGQYEEDSVTENYKHLAVSSQKVDGTKSFTYEVTFKYTGYGAGLALNVTDRDNFWAVEANQNFEFYFPTVQNGSWNKWASDGKAISEAQAENEYHTMVFDYNAENGSAAVSYDGEVMATISYVNPNIWGGYLGLYYEDAEVTFTKAVYTEKSDGGSSEIPVNSFETNMGEWSSADGFEWKETTLGYACVGDISNKHLAKSSIVIDGTKSFEYEVTFTYDGHGAGLAFWAESTSNMAAVEINREGRFYFPLIIDGAWTTFYADGMALSEEQLAAGPHTLKFVYDALDEYAEVYLDGVIMAELYGFDVSVICGNLGLYNESGTAYFTRAVYTELEMPDPTPTPEAAASPEAAATPEATEEAEATETPASAPEEDSVNPVLIVVVIVLACAALAAGVIFIIKLKKK